MRGVLYSLSVGAERCERQWIASVRSLRRHNPAIPVHLALYGDPGEHLLSEAKRQRVGVVQHGAYADCLEMALPGRGRLMAGNPTLHKIASMRDLPEGLGQVLYLDCDTFCFGDVGLLFDRYRHAHLHAREEPGSRRSPYGYDPAYVDEAALAAVAHAEGLVSVPPYNTGVMMLNGGLWRRLGELFGEFLDLVWRLSPRWSEPERRLAMPTGNAWIVEEVATWLLLGRFPDLLHAQFEPAAVAQNGETAAGGAGGRRPWLAHYFSGGEAAFFAALAREEGLAA